MAKVLRGKPHPGFRREFIASRIDPQESNTGRSGGRVIMLHRMTRGRRRDYISEKKESVVPFGGGQRKETLVTSNGSPTEACWVSSTHTHTGPHDTSTCNSSRYCLVIVCFCPCERNKFKSDFLKCILHAAWTFARGSCCSLRVTCAMLLIPLARSSSTRM